MRHSAAQSAPNRPSLGGMPEISEYKPGMPCWVDLNSSDIEASKAFYTGLFGWETGPTPPPEAGGYTMFMKGGQEVAAVGPIQNEGQPPVWVTYAAVDKVKDLGGSVLSPPMDIPAGRFAVVADNQGSSFGVIKL